MFFLGYLRSELVRRKSRTILTVLGLAVGVSPVMADPGPDGGSKTPGRDSRPWG